MMTVFNSLVQSFDLNKTSTGQTVAKGKDCFKVFYNELSGIFYYCEIDGEFNREGFNEKFDEWYLGKHRSDLSQYFRVFHNMLLYLDHSDFNEQQNYANTLTALLSDHELVILYYFAVSERGKSLRKYLIQFDALVSLPEDLLFATFHKNLLS